MKKDVKELIENLPERERTILRLAADSIHTSNSYDHLETLWSIVNLITGYSVSNCDELVDILNEN